MLLALLFVLQLVLASVHSLELRSEISLGSVLVKTLALQLAIESVHALAFQLEMS